VVYNRPIMLFVSMFSSQIELTRITIRPLPAPLQCFNHCGCPAALTWGLVGGQITHSYPGLKQACSAFLLACVGPRRHGHNSASACIRHSNSCERRIC
jgi:hypothetical protein